MDETHLWGVQQGGLKQAWGIAVPFLERLGDHTDLTLDEIKDGLEDQRFQMWITWDDKIRGVCITEIFETTEGLICCFVVAAGDRFRSLQHLGVIERWARSKGCFACEIKGRRGWGRILDGYENRGRDGPKHIWRKVLKNGKQ